MYKATNNYHDSRHFAGVDYEKLVGYMPYSFADLVFVGERIEVGLKRGKFDYVSPAGTSNRRIGAAGAKKKGRGHPVSYTHLTLPTILLV